MKNITTIKLSKKTVELLNKLKIHPRQAYEEVVLELLKGNKKGQINISWLIFTFISVLTLIAGLLFIKSGITGLVIFEENAYTQVLDLEVNNNSEYVLVLENPGKLKSIKLNGIIEQNAIAKVYLEHDNVQYLIFDSSKLGEESSKITGFVVKNDSKVKKDKKNNTKINKTIINETTNNETIEKIINKSIKINLAYKEDSVYDEDNDGIETLTGIIDLTVENTLFNWEVDESNLCTRWETFSIENEASNVVCYGSGRCCEFIDSLATRWDWNEPYYSSYGTDGATSNNIVSAQILYIDYDLSVDEPFAEIYNSEWSGLKTEYQEQIISFNDICIETCSLGNFNESEYRLIFEVNGFLEINSIDYVIEEEVSTNVSEVNITPVKITPENITGLALINDIPHQTISRNSETTIDLDNYFSGIDNSTVFTYNEIDNIIIIFENNIATIVPDKGFIGTEFTFITAVNDNVTVNSNVFSITVTEKKVKDCSDFIRTDNGLYYCNDDEKFYSCSGFEDAGDLRRCKEAKFVKDTVDKSMCPFKHKDCVVPVDQNINQLMLI